MKRTEEQIAADEALSAAIERAVRAYDMISDGEVNGEYVIIIDQQRMEPDGEISNSYCTLLKDGKIAATHAIGLMETASFDLKMARNSE